MTKKLNVKDIDKCVGCELCVLEAQRQLKKVGLEGSLIRVFKEKEENSEYLKNDLEIDPRINLLDIEKIKNICPKGVFEIIEESNTDDLRIEKNSWNRFKK